MIQHPFYIDKWQVTPATNTLRLGDIVKTIEPKAMNVLILLCLRQGDVLSSDEIVAECWGNAEIGDNPVHKVITQLRKALGDKASTPSFIETIRKRGYRVIAEVAFPLEDTEEASSTEWTGGSPFVGLSAFNASDSHVFFGRNEQVATLLRQISKQVRRKRTFCLILGPSGTGKSSIVSAGVLPKLQSSQGYDGIRVVSYTSLDFADISDGRLLLDLAGTLLDWDIDGIPVFDGLSADKLANDLQTKPDTIISHLQTVCENAFNPALTVKVHLFLFLDRLEILLSSPVFSSEEKANLLLLIEKLATAECVIVFSACRNDFYPLVVTHQSLMADKASGAHFDLAAPTYSALSQIIRLPASAANLTWTKDEKTGLYLDEILATEASNNPDSLPMLQYTLQELYLQRSENNELQATVYRSLGGIEGAVGKKAEEIHQQLPESHQQEFSYILSLLVTLNSDGQTITSRAARWSQLSKTTQYDFVQAMIDSRLFVSHLQNNEPCFSVTHEALLRRWPRASEWIKAHRESLIIKSRLQEASKRWVQEKHNSAYLLASGKPLLEALSLKSDAALTLDPNELKLIKFSQKRAKFRRWTRQGVVTLLCLLTFTSAFMSYKGQQSEQLAQEKRLEAENLLGFMVGEFADKLRSVQRMDLLDGISNKALEYFSTQESQPNNTLFSFTDNKITQRSQFQHAQTLQAMGEVAYSRGTNNEAEQAFLSAESILNTLLVEDKSNLELLQLKGLNAFWRGQLAFDSGQSVEAQTAFEEYLLLSQAMLELAPNDLDVQMEVAYSHSALGSVAASRQDYVYALQSFELALEITTKVQTKRPNNTHLQLVKTDFLTWIADSQKHLGNLAKTLEIHKQNQIELDAVLAFNSNDVNIIISLGYAHWHQARILYTTNNYIQAYENIEKAKAYFNNALGQDPDNVVWQQHKMRIQILLFNIIQFLSENQTQQLSRARTETEQGIDFINQSNAIPPLLINEIIEFYQSNNKWDLSMLFIQKSQTTINKNNKINWSGLYRLAYSQLLLLTASQEAYSNNTLNAQGKCEEAIAYLTPLVAKSNSFDYLIHYVQAHQCTNQLKRVSNEIAILRTMGIVAEPIF
nr:winged helix-turn-helix domain-containing protein [Alteromonas sp. 5E99-2]